MMQQKIVIMLKPKCDKCRSKAMKIAAVADGVISVAWEGEEKNKMVMIGDGTDAATVTRRLRKKLGYADLQKIAVKVQVRCKKCRSKAMKIVAVVGGLIFSVAWEGGDKDKVVVIGDGVDAATLTRNLRNFSVSRCGGCDAGIGGPWEMVVLVVFGSRWEMGDVVLGFLLENGGVFDCGG
ncbi:hypothetical protein EZV62_009375 [Acer yangbiense]|uniref:HMA domain-containing protein n=1 Tax=Acer yangbiense TaxID=1000413 RepID=A0A5C7IFH4_9ROSI|nr:hypothetical protein EZV62_009375 [Acer yangbiense]